MKWAGQCVHVSRESTMHTLSLRQLRQSQARYLLPRLGTPASTVLLLDVQENQWAALF